jgi:16S rRNA (cytidine1402-2'-O)-methyltransferase
MTLKEAVDYYAQAAPKGEFVLVIEGAKPPEKVKVSLEEALVRINELRGEGMSLKDAVKKCAEETGFQKNELYQAALGK